MNLALISRAGLQGRRVSQSGFSLLEILIVLVIIGLLGGLVGPRLLDRLEVSKTQTAETQVRQLKSALDVMRLDIGRYPTQEEGLALLITPPSDASLRMRWRGPYLEGEGVPKDPWQNPYIYGSTNKPNQPFALYSYGSTGKPGGEGPNAPIGFLP
jgi:general secretion pathway protein G